MGLIDGREAAAARLRRKAAGRQAGVGEEQHTEASEPSVGPTDPKSAPNSKRRPN